MNRIFDRLSLLSVFTSARKGICGESSYPQLRLLNLYRYPKILNQEKDWTDQNNGNAYIDIDIGGISNDAACKQGNGGSKQTGLWIWHGWILL